MTMQALRKIFTLMVVVVWPLLSGHCLLEALPEFSFLKCEAESKTDSDCCQDAVCQTVESGGYKIEDQQALILSSAALPELETAGLTLDLPPPPAGSLSLIFTTAPPEFPASRQFVFRTASSPRAPSILS